MASSVAGSGALVPALFWLQMQNAFLQAVRKQRLAREIVEARFDDLDRLTITVDVLGSTGALKAGIALAERFGLSAYDAAYLELAIRARRPLMTRDEQLRNAAREMHALWEPRAARNA